VANYILRYRKKWESMARREHDLICALTHGEKPQKLIHAAERVREAKLAVFKAERAKIGPSAEGTERNRRLIVEMEARSAQWSSMPTEEIIASYRKRVNTEHPA
jgi:hypothetical protein